MGLRVLDERSIPAFTFGRDVAIARGVPEEPVVCRQVLQVSWSFTRQYPGRSRSSGVRPRAMYTLICFRVSQVTFLSGIGPSLMKSNGIRPKTGSVVRRVASSNESFAQSPVGICSSPLLCPCSQSHCRLQNPCLSATMAQVAIIPIIGKIRIRLRG